MGTLGSLFNKAAGNTTCEFKEEESIISTSSTVPEILDWIMIKLCTELDVREMAFKGGYMLSKLLPENEVRGTRDIDFSIMTKNYYEDIKRVMAAIGEELFKLGVVSSYEIKPTVEPTMSGGVNYYMADETKHIGIDVGLHDISYGVHSVTVTGQAVNAFTPERMLSDKISAMFTRKRFRRSKDLYDLYVITNTFDVDLNVLTELIAKRGELDYGLSPLRDEIMDGYKHAYDMLDINVNNTDIGNTVRKPSFEEVIDRARVIINNLNTQYHWNHVKRLVE